MRYGGLNPTAHSFWHCQLHADQREELFDSLSEIIKNDVQVYSSSCQDQILLCDSESLIMLANLMILEATVEYNTISLITAAGWTEKDKARGPDVYTDRREVYTKDRGIYIFRIDSPTSY